jgi:rare lipoprotein A
MATSAVALLAANCASPPSKTRTAGGVDPKYGVAASPRVVAEGSAVPKGGGRKMVGRAYTIAGKRYVPKENPSGYSQSGIASWYGAAFHGRLTANGEIFDKQSISAAHPTLPLPSYARVTNTRNGHSIIVRVNDRGPYHGGRLIDVSERVAKALDFKHLGTARVKVDYVRPATTKGSDDRILIASLQTNGSPARMPGDTTPPPSTMVASAPRVSEPPTVRGAPIGNLLAFRTERAAPGSTPASGVTVIERAPAVQPATVVLASAEIPSGVPAAGVPLPPDRPFDLGAFMRPEVASASGLRPGQASPGVNAQVASLFFTAAEAPRGGFDRRTSAFDAMRTADLFRHASR